MTETRKFLGRHHWLCALFLSATLVMKALMPTGFMPVVSNGVILVQLCSGQGPRTIAMELPGKAGDHGENKNTEAPCAFAGLSSPTLAAAGAVLLAVALAFIIATDLRLAPRIVLWRGIYLRPPAIGPPAA